MVFVQKVSVSIRDPGPAFAFKAALSKSAGHLLGILEPGLINFSVSRIHILPPRELYNTVRFKHRPRHVVPKNIVDFLDFIFHRRQLAADRLDSSSE